MTAAAMTAATMSAAAMSAATATVAATSAAMTANKLYVRPSYAFAFLVEDVEGRQFFFSDSATTESDLIAISVAWSE